MRIFFIAASAALFLAGCANQQDIDDPKMFGRVDCKRASASADIQTQYELDKQVCLGRANAAGLSGTSAMHGYGIVGAINQSMTATSIAGSTATSCMAERNYLYARRSEHTARCQGVDPVKGRQLSTANTETRRQ